jgi:hypothetical protein
VAVIELARVGVAVIARSTPRSEWPPVPDELGELRNVSRSPDGRTWYVAVAVSDEFMRRLVSDGEPVRRVRFVRVGHRLELELEGAR